jgi:aspartyl-tRNA synthetase
VTPKPWPRIPYAEAMRKYGSDKPDLRNPIVMQNVSEHFLARLGLQAVRAAARAAEERSLGAIPAPGGGQRTFADRMNSWAQGEGQPGLGYILFFDRAKDETTLAADKRPASAAGPLANNIGPERARRSRSSASRRATRRSSSPAIRRPIRQVRGLGAHRSSAGAQADRRRTRFEFAWIVDFPMYEWNEDEKKIDFSHNPFSMPQGGLEAL